MKCTYFSENYRWPAILLVIANFMDKASQVFVAPETVILSGTLEIEGVGKT